ncbi:MAG TPA: hypothetical protein VGQ36_21235 [Thermoanaerobaculia bacterium]|nr:hypothetical protein [Thermoanaerobaculia bacterium]
MLALLVFLLGLEGVDRALIEREMESMKPPREPIALRALGQWRVMDPLPQPPPPAPLPGDKEFFP